jgi:hypothetical protein
MGMYTEFVFGGALHDDVPENVITILKYIVEPPGSEQENNYLRRIQVPNHPFFGSDRWKRIAVSSSCYFGYNQSHSALVYDGLQPPRDRRTNPVEHQELQTTKSRSLSLGERPLSGKGPGSRIFSATRCTSAT